MTSPATKRSRILLLAILLGLTFLVSLAFVRWRNRGRKGQHGYSQPPETPEGSPIPYGVLGLTEAEVVARKPEFDLEAEQRKEDRQYLRATIRQSLLTTYNIDLFGIAIILFFLDNFWGALGTVVVILINLFLNVFQQVYTKQQLNEIVNNLRPQANVIRDGRLQSIDPPKIVDGDYLVIGEGDEFLVDGELIGNRSIMVEQIEAASLESEQVAKHPGDAVVAGSHCLEGRTIYRAREPGLNRYKSIPGQRLELLLGELTPLERFIEIVFRILFGLVLIFSLILLVDALIINANLVSSEYHDAFSTIFGVAPTSLFFLLIVTYVVGVLRISDRGALVYEATSIERMANARRLCISRDSLLSGFQVNLEPIETTDSMETLSEILISRMLGDFIHSMPSLNVTDQMLVQAFPGQPRAAVEIAPIFREQGWLGATFDKTDLRGTFILGFPDVVESHLLRERETGSEEIERRWVDAQRWITRWMRNRVGDQEPAVEAEPPAPPEPIPAESVETQPGLMDRAFIRLDQILSPMEDQAFYKRQPQEAESELRLTFAYAPELRPLYDPSDQPDIPSGLIPLANVTITEILRPEAENSIRALLDTGLDVKILSHDPPEETIQTALDLDLPEGDLPMTSGQELAQLEKSEFAQKVREATLIGGLTPSQKAAVVESLHAQSGGVIFVGRNVADIPALLQANLRVVLRQSAQAAMKLTDVVLLDDSLAALPHVVITGQRLVKGILDVFKLYLSFTIAQLSLLLFMLFLGMEEFPMHPTQVGLVIAFAIAIPNTFLAVWASAGRSSERVIRRQLAQFIFPAALTTAVLAWGVHTFFSNQTQNNEYARLAVTFAMLMAGWLRVLFVQPPSTIWAGGAPLRGDRRVYWVVLGSMLLFAAVISVPLFAEWLRTSWLREPLDYLWVVLAVAVWALLTRAIWRSRWLDWLINRI